MDNGMNGVQRIAPEAAISTADTMKGIADGVERLLNDVSKMFEDINDESTGTYHGAKKPSELRRELDDFKATFAVFKQQIDTYASNIIETASTWSAQ